jgi:hypothetical protein
MLGVECIQAYRVLVKKLRRGKENYRDPGTITAILRRYHSRGVLTDEQVEDFLSAGHADHAGSRRRSQERRGTPKGNRQTPSDEQ